jgi:hypothetical protein
LAIAINFGVGKSNIKIFVAYLQFQNSVKAFKEMVQWNVEMIRSNTNTVEAI